MEKPPPETKQQRNDRLDDYFWRDVVELTRNIIIPNMGLKLEILWMDSYSYWLARMIYNEVKK